MNRAATEDETGMLVWPIIRAMLRRVKAPNAQAAGAVALIDDWVHHGAPTVGNPPRGPDPIRRRGGVPRGMAAHLRCGYGPAVREAPRHV